MSDRQQSRTLLPCSGCGRDLMRMDGVEDTKATVEYDDGFTFQGETPELEVPAKVCPECGEVTAL